MLATMKPAELVPLAASLARPVARGWMSLGDAHASLIAEAVKAERTGDLGGLTAPNMVKGLQHILSLHLEALERRRDLAAYRIRQRLRPLIASRRPSNVLFAEAHDVNGADDFPLAEEEVTDMVRREMYFALPVAPSGGRRHAG
jgi:hypothetical protein